MTREASIVSVPLVSLHLTERCNSRCVTCDYWRHGRADLGVESVTQLLPQLRKLGTKTVLVSGGEPLIHPQWREIAALLHGHDLDLWLLTSGLSLAKHARPVAELFRSVTVSLDGADPATYQAIRGLDAFDNVCAGIRAVAQTDTPVSIRVTVQRQNYRQLPALVELAHELGVAQISFLAADVRNMNAFGRAGDFTIDAALHSDDLTVFSDVLLELEREHAEDFRSGFIAESPQKLRRLLAYYSALRNRGAFPQVRCNAPEFSVVIEPSGRVNPCFFIPGPPVTAGSADLTERINDPAMVSLRTAIRERRRPECVTCVCSMWREPHEPKVAFLDSAHRRPFAVQRA